MSNMNTRLSRVAIAVGLFVSVENTYAQIVANGTSEVLPDGYTTTTVNANAPEIWATNAGNITASGALNVTSEGAFSPGVQADNTGQVSLAGPTSITTSGGNAAGIDIQSGGKAELSGATVINTTGGDASGINSSGTGTSLISNGDLSVTVASAHGLYVTNGSSVEITGGKLNVTNNSNAATSGLYNAIDVSGQGTQLSVNASGLIQTSSMNPTPGGNNASAVSVTNGANAILNGTADASLNLKTVGQFANGITIFAGGAGASTVDAKNLAISTSGSEAFGIFSGDTLSLSDSSIVTSGDESAGIRLLGASSTANTQNTEISTSGERADAIIAVAGAQNTLSNMTLTTTGYESHGLHADLNSSITSGGSLNVNVSGGLANAVKADRDSKVDINDTFTIISTGDDSSTVYAGENGEVNINGSGNIVKQSPFSLLTAAALYSTSGGTITLNSPDLIHVKTEGSNVHGAYVAGSSDAENPSTININKTEIITSGFGAVGAYAMSQNATLNINNSSITTEDNLAAGVMARDGATASLTNTAVVTQKNTAAGLRAVNNGSITALNSTIETSGSESPGVSLEGGDVALKNTDVTTSGTLNSPGIKQYRGDSSMSMTGGSLIANAGESISGSGGTADIELSGVNATVNNGLFLQNTETSALSVTATQNSVLAGDAINTSSGAASLSLDQGSSWTGKSQDMTNIGVANGSQWNVTGNSTADAITMNTGTINFMSDSPGVVKSVTTTSLSGNGGNIKFNTVLNEGGANSISDTINVSGNASGAYTISINKLGGNGALTVNDGIKLASIGEQDNTSLQLANPVTAGAYEYLAYNGGQSGNGWYLRSTLSEVPPTPGTDPGTDPGTNPGTDPGTNPVTPPNPGSNPPSYNPSVPGYVIGPYINRLYGYQTLGTLHERVGEQETLRNQPDENNGIWARVHGGEQKSDAGRFGYDADTWFLQFGGDLYQAYSDSGARTHAGIFATLGQVSTGINDSLRGRYMGRSKDTGDINSKGYGLGAYFTRYADDSSYIDTVIQYTHYKNDYNSIYGDNASQDGDGMALSLEVGKPFKHTSGWYIEPQAQIMYQYLHLESFNDEVAKVSGTSDNSGLARLGARIGYDSIETSKAHPYLIADVLSIIGRSPDVTISGTTINQSYSNAWGQLGGGVTGELTKNTSIYADMKYQKAFDGDMHGFTGTLGFRVNW